MNRFSTLLVLIALLLTALMINVDYTAVNLALFKIAKDLDSNLITIQWTLSAYVLAWAAVIMPAGKLADKYGHMTFCLLGLALFTLASLLAGLAPTAGWLITARSLQGIAGGMFIPAMYVLIHHLFPEQRRGFAIGIMSLGVGVGLALGPIVGGVLLSTLGWRSIFFINLPIGLFALFCLYQQRRAAPQVQKSLSLDKLSATLLGGGIVLLFYVLNNWTFWGSNTAFYVGLVIIALLFITSFFFRQNKTPSPLMPLSLFRNSAFLGCLLAFLIEQYGFATIIVSTGIYLQKILGYSILSVSLLYLPITLIFGIFAALGGSWIDRIGLRLPSTVGFLIMAAASIGFSLLPLQPDLFMTVIVLSMLGLGMGLAFTALNTGVVKTVSADQVGIASSIFSLFALLGNSLGVAMTVMIYEKSSQIKWLINLKTFNHSLTSQQLDQLQHHLSSVIPNSGKLSSFSKVVQQELIQKSSEALHYGINHVMLLNSLLCLVALILCSKLLRDYSLKQRAVIM